MNNQPYANATSSGTPAFGKLHCPECKSENFTTATEHSIENGALITYVCSNCTAKFHNMQSVKEAAEKNRNDSRTSMIVSSVTGFISILLFILGVILLENDWVISTLCFSFSFTILIFTIVFFCFIFVYNNRAKKLESELAYLKENCLN